MVHVLRVFFQFNNVTHFTNTTLSIYVYSICVLPEDVSINDVFIITSSESVINLMDHHTVHRKDPALFSPR